MDQRYTLQQLDDDLHERIRLKRERRLLEVPAYYHERYAPECKGKCAEPKTMVPLGLDGQGLTCCHFAMAAELLNTTKVLEEQVRKKIETGRHRLSAVLDQKSTLKRMEQLRGTTSLKQSYQRTHTGTARIRALSDAKTRADWARIVDGQEGVEDPGTPQARPKDHPKDHRR